MFIWLCVAQLCAAQGSVATAGPQTVNRLQSLTLGNGLRILVQEQHDNPSLAVCASYRAGSRDDPQDKAGLAHLVGQLLFQGSRNLTPDDAYRLISEHGGEITNTVSADITQLCVALPANSLALALWLQSEVMRDLNISNEAFGEQRDLVVATLLSSPSERAHDKGRARVRELAFEDYWPYQHDPLGEAATLTQLGLSDALDFYLTHYSPGNAAISIVGDVNSAQAVALSRQYFETIPTRVVTAAPLVASPAFRQSSERFDVVTDRHCIVPGVFYGYRIPGFNIDDHLALELIRAILTTGDSARLPFSLIPLRTRALAVEGWLTGNQLSDLFGIYVTVAPLSSVDKIHEVLAAELKRLRFLGPSQGELAKAKAQLRSEILRQVSTPAGLAAELGRTEVLALKAGSLEGQLALLPNITAQRIRQVVKAYLPDSQRSIVEIYPPSWVQDPTAPSKRDSDAHK
ncbi:MAG TPA: pitrilysin family protein [Polyangiaceae bacterium]|nr:pitrilysin family protein [Polyangiaceae bacterium]